MTKTKWYSKPIYVLVALALVLSLAIVAVPMAGTVEAATPIYVDASRPDDSEDGTSWATAKKTIGAGISVVDVGGTVIVAAGTYTEHVTISKSLTLQGEDRDTTVIDGSGSGKVIHITAHYVTISGLKVTNGEYGIWFPPNGYIGHITMRDVIIDSNDKHGIDIVHTGGYFLIEDSVISNNGGDGLYKAHQFHHSTIRNCEVFGNNGTGLHAGWGSGTLITNNKVHHNGGIGIWFDSMSNSIMEKNEVYNNGVGIGVGYVGKNNTLRDNIVHHNTVFGIYMNYSPVTGNKIYHNDLIENTTQARELGNNIWDNGYPSGGNYWSDYAGVDDYSGPGQNLPGSDGIGDTPYAFTGNQDNYPLMRPWGAVTIDIKPGSDPNSINLKSKGVIPVAILTTPDLDATTVDAETVRFGPDQAHQSHYALEDVDGDGDLDLVLHFRTQDSGIAPSDTSAMLVGWTYASGPIIGFDSVNIVPKKGKK